LQPPAFFSDIADRIARVRAMFDEVVKVSPPLYELQSSWRMAVAISWCPSGRQ
jgi:hypothetical protein